MPRVVLLIFALGVLPLAAQDDGPPISITSPDKATTYAVSTIKHRALIWNQATKTLSAEVTFVEESQDLVQSGDDTHRFRLPGITFDAAHGIFYATTPQGEPIPVAHKKKTLFITSIEVMPNAAVRVLHPRGNVSVILEAIRPADVAKLRQTTDPDGTHSVDLRELLP